MKHILLALILSMVYFSSAGAVERWHADELVGYMLELDSKTAVQQFSFTERGDALATLGTKDGPLCAPIVLWKIETDGILRIMINEKDSMVLKKLKVVGNKYYVEEDGVRCEYTRKEENKAFHSNVKK